MATRYPEMAEKARRNLGQIGPNSEVATGAAEALPFEDGTWGCPAGC